MWNRLVVIVNGIIDGCGWRIGMFIFFFFGDLAAYAYVFITIILNIATPPIAMR